MRPTITLLIICAVCACAMAAAAAAPQKMFPYPYQQHDFNNGLRLITVPTDFPNVVSLYIVVATGSRNEVELGKTGFAHFFEHMMFRGTKEYPPDKYNDVIKKAGASFNAYTSDDLTAYHTTFSKPDLETILRMEADRFQNLSYSEDVFKTEALAVLGEYNKNSASPGMKISEQMRGLAFQQHTYRHTTMGFLKDIQDMPNQYAYSKMFFDRYYRPEYTTIIVAGDVNNDATRAMVEKHWGAWKRGSYNAPIPKEPAQDGPRQAHIDWPSPTLPWTVVAFRAAAYSDDAKDSAALDLLSFLAFSENSPLYRKLVLEDQKVDLLSAGNADHVDPYLFTVHSRVKKAADMDSVREQILSTLAGFKDTLVSAEELDKVKRHVRYSFALGMDNSEALAGVLASYVALRRTPETINRVYDLYSQITPEDIRNAARKYFVESGRTTVTLTGVSK
ncbi:MAG: insulinase family protein [Acidobacteriia bacterium]|nr:insulinase family protein [Terriglobia bacterium]